MTGLLIALGLALVMVALLSWLGLRGSPALFAAAVLAAGLAGYAGQGRPALGGAPRQALLRAAPLSLAEPRARLLGDFPANGHWLTMADSFEARGDTEQAVRLLQQAVRLHPDGYALWVGLGNALTDHARQVTPAARFAFERAQALAPLRPAPRFFYGLALARSGDRDGALGQWQALLNDTPDTAPWRSLVVDVIAVFAPPPPPRRQAAPVPR